MTIELFDINSRDVADFDLDFEHVYRVDAGIPYQRVWFTVPACCMNDAEKMADMEESAIIEFHRIYGRNARCGGIVNENDYVQALQGFCAE